MSVDIKDAERLGFHLNEALEERRRFENAAQSVSRMILERGVEKTTRAGQTMYEYKFFREGEKHTVGWFQEINELVNFIKDAAAGGSAKEMAFVFIGEPGNGKTFFVEYICKRYRQFLTRPENRRYTFEFTGLEKLGRYGNITIAQSDTFEDPAILAMNLFESEDQNKKYLSLAGFDDKKIRRLYANYRPLGASTEYIWSQIRDYCDSDIEKMLNFVRVVRVPIAENLGAVTGKYAAGDKITSSGEDLRGYEDLHRTLNIPDTSNPYRYSVRDGSLGRTGGGGIHFADELFKNKVDLINIYLQVIQNRNIELKSYRWPIDVLILATSNNAEYNDFISQPNQAPIKDRCRLCYVAHNTDYKLQKELTIYALGSTGEKRTTVTEEEIHEDPNLNYALSVAMSLTRLPQSDKLTPIEMMKLEAGETAAEKKVTTLTEIKKLLNANQDVTKRWGQKGVGHRGLERVVQIMLALSQTHEGKCLFAKDCFDAIEREILDYVQNAVDRDKYMKDLGFAKNLYRTEIKTSIFNAFLDDPDAISKEVLRYVNMVIGVGSDQLGPDKMWRYKDRNGEIKPIKIDERYINSVETRLGLTTKERKEAFRDTIRRTYGQKIVTEPNYNFMDNIDLVKAVTDVRLESDVAGEASLVGVLSNRANEENAKLRTRMMSTMLDKLGYCNTCAQGTIEYYCEKTDES